MMNIPIEMLWNYFKCIYFFSFWLEVSILESFFHQLWSHEWIWGCPLSIRLVAHAFEKSWWLTLILTCNNLLPQSLRAERSKPPQCACSESSRSAPDPYVASIYTLQTCFKPRQGHFNYGGPSFVQNRFYKTGTLDFLL